MNDSVKLKSMLLVLAVVAGFGALVFLLWPAKSAPEAGGLRPVAATNPGSPPIPPTSGEKHTRGVSRLELTAQGLRNRQGKDARELLQGLRQELAGLDAAEAVRLIRGFLDSREDAGTGLGFVVGGGGAIAEAPTLRVFLLDLLGQLDPAAAAAYARVVLGSMESPDEWALALRNLARGDTSTEARTLLEQKVGELLRHEAWQQNPSVGYLEAFDVAVFAGGTQLIAPLSDLVRKQDNPAAAHAAFLALDRLVMKEPESVLARLAQEPELMAGREATRADFFARADVSQIPQRAVVESYLLGTARGAAEWAAFAGVFPNANFMISHNLLTVSGTLSHEELVRRDRAALQIVMEWQQDPRFAGHRGYLQQIAKRLEGFVKEAK